ncbi:MAG: PH domain-containing protein [Thermoflexales bacterium]
MGYVQGLLGENERIVLIRHRHWIVWRLALLVSLLLAGVIVVASVVAATVLPADITGAARYLPFALLIVPIVWFLPTYVRWSAEQYIVTNRRIIQIEGVINKHTIDSSLDKINDVVLDQSFWGRILGYGDLEILTGSDIGLNKLQQIQDPLKFKKAMLDAKEELRQLGAEPNVAPAAHAPDQTLSASLQELADAHQKGLITDDEYKARRAEMIENI